MKKDCKLEFIECEGCHKTKIPTSRTPVEVDGEFFKLCGSCAWKLKLHQVFDGFKENEKKSIEAG